LWNRAIDTITRLRPSISTTLDANPFEMTSLQSALPSTGQSNATPIGATPNENRRILSSNLGRPAACELEWSLSEGLLSTLFFLSETYFLRGSPREAEYFARQAAELAEQLNAPAMASRAVAKLGEVQLHMGRFEDAHSSLTKAGDGLQGMPGLDAADIRRLKMEYRMRTSEGDETTDLFEETMRMFEDLDNAFQQFDSVAFGYVVSCRLVFS
jgi:separase